MPYSELIPAILLPLALLLPLDDQEAAAPVVYPDPPEGSPPLLEVENALAKTAEEMKPYTESIPGSEATFEMLPLPGGSFSMGSPEGEAKRGVEEGPVHVPSVGAQHGIQALIAHGMARVINHGSARPIVPDPGSDLGVRR